MARPDSDNNHFRQFAQTLSETLVKYETDSEESLLERQRRQLKLLVALELEFKQELIKHPWGSSSYQAFISLILDTKRNILAARPYFRERQEVFSAEISRALKARNDKSLYKFKVNYSFIGFVMSQRNWKTWPQRNTKILALDKQIREIRTEITEMNLPLALSQSRLFYASTPKSHLSYMDIVQVHVGGLLAGIDKFVPPDTSEMTNEEELQAYRVFRAVVLGRMMGDRVSEFSATLLHFWPSDKRKIYRALKARRRLDASDAVDYDAITQKVNDGITNKNHHTDCAEIAQLIASASTTSGDVSLDPEGETTLERAEDKEEHRPDLQVEEIECRLAVRREFKNLRLVERKLLALKGVSI